MTEESIREGGPLPQGAIATGPAKSPVRKPVISVDFDGTIHSYTTGWKGADIVSDPPIPGAMQFLTDACEMFEVNIHSSRSGKPGGIMAMYEYIREHLHRYWVDDPARADRVLSQIKFPVDKPAAHVILDDRAIPFNGTYPDLDELAAFKPWNKRESIS